MAHGNAGARNGGGRPPLWLVDWSDSEHEDFRWACEAAGVEARVLRGPALGTSVGTRLHRLRSWPAYSSLALRGLHEAGGAPLIAWQPIAGALAGLLRRCPRPPLVVLNPIIDPATSTLRRRLILRGIAHADRVLYFSTGALEDGVRLGLDRQRLRFVPLGVKPTLAWRPPTGDYFLAIGRAERDWVTLAQAADGVDCEVRVVGPADLPEPGPLRLLPQLERTRLLTLMEGARAIVVPLNPTARSAGQLTVLDGLSAGRAVVTTRTPCVEDYVTPETGILVPPHDAPALRKALLRLSDQSLAEQMGRAALAAAGSAFSLDRFVADVDGEARSITY
ncbi:MAG TPA: glycosyltransferase [Streptosporangiaceae bacterium]|jgi:glycosyltransferase involved in cell wall biosynthesis